MGQLEDLYQEIILEHNRSPRNSGPLQGATHAADGRNPLCGDEVHLSLTLREGLVREASFQGQGCAIATASASLLTEAVQGRNESEVRELAFRVLESLGTTSGDSGLGAYGDLVALEGVRRYPARIKCATLPWQALLAALEGKEQITTENRQENPL